MRQNLSLVCVELCTGNRNISATGHATQEVCCFILIRKSCKRQLLQQKMASIPVDAVNHYDRSRCQLVKDVVWYALVCAVNLPAIHEENLGEENST